MITKLSEMWPTLTRLARAEGVLRLGASDLRDEHADRFAEWIAAGRHASMGYLEKNREIRAEPSRRFPWAKSVVVILVPYSPERPHAPQDALSNHVARYALGDDYHDVLDRMLRKFEAEISAVAPHAKTWRYVDTGPLSDRSMAAQAGLGWIGKNGMLIDEEYGSYFFIGTLVTSLENDIAAHEVADRCGACTRCLDACPTNVILPDRTVDSGRCISYATIEHRGGFKRDMAEHLAGNAFGCDICQEVCPWNRAPAEPHPAFVPRDSYRATPVTDLLRFEQADFSRLFTKSAIKRAKLEGMRRNVAAVAGSGDAEGASDDRRIE
ncbi:MAG TPA: tRNA epoxyqueuosine(34) reductase QueG [Thermoanaerobaculia bacterium]